LMTESCQLQTKLIERPLWYLASSIADVLASANARRPGQENRTSVLGGGFN